MVLYHFILGVTPIIWRREWVKEKPGTLPCSEILNVIHNKYSVVYFSFSFIKDNQQHFHIFISISYPYHIDSSLKY